MKVAVSWLVDESLQIGYDEVNKERVWYGGYGTTIVPN